MGKPEDGPRKAVVRSGSTGQRTFEYKSRMDKQAAARAQKMVEAVRRMTKAQAWMDY